MAHAAHKIVTGRVLLVEDDTTTGPWLSKRLERHDIECTWVKTYEEAMAAFNDQVYHAVVTDIYLGGDKDKESGLKVVEEIGKTGTPLVIITSAADLEIAKTGMNQGAGFLLEKPFEPEQLLKVLENLWEEPKGLNSLMERFLDMNGLTAKEKDITRLLLKGLSNKEVASVSGNTEKTVKFHLTTIFDKCGVGSRTELFNSIFPT
jgi:DNA-binding NarL/FixJ family response regulator